MNDHQMTSHYHRLTTGMSDDVIQDAKRLAHQIEEDEGNQNPQEQRRREAAAVARAEQELVARLRALATSSLDEESMRKYLLSLRQQFLPQP